MLDDFSLDTSTPPDSTSGDSSFLLGSTPSFLLAADAHNTLAQKPSFLDPTQWGNNASNIGKFSAATGVAALTSIGNSIITVGNWFGMDESKLKTGQIIQELDDDLGLYYNKNKEAVDVTGDVLGSLVPGTIGIKGLNWGQRVLRSVEATGSLGANFTRATGLLAPSTGKYIEQAIGSFAGSGSVFKLTEVNTLKALVAGAGQSALESAAFETAVQLTMHDSPILEGQDYKDIAINIGWGTLYGTIGGTAFTAAKTIGGITKGIRGVDEAAKPFTHITETPVGTGSYEKILWWMNDRNNIPTPFGPREAQFAGFARTKVEKIDNLVRLEFQKLVGGDAETANLLADSVRGMSQDDVFANIMHLGGASRMSSLLPIEKAFNKSTVAMTDEELKAWNNLSVHHLKTWGEGAGSVTAEGPSVLSISDTLEKGQRLAVKGNNVIAVDSSSGKQSKVLFTHDLSKPWNALEVNSAQEAEARYMVALHSPKLPEGVTIHEFDIPLLEKALREKTQKVTLLWEDGSKLETEHPSGAVVAQDVEEAKRNVADRLVKAKETSNLGKDPEAVATKLKQLLGINFNIVDDPSIIGSWQPGKIASHRGDVRGFAIQLSKQALTTQPLSRLIQTLKHEEGHGVFDTMLDIGMIPGSKMYDIRQEAELMSRKMRPLHWKDVDNGTGNKAYMTSDHELMADSFAYLSRYPQDLPKFPIFQEQVGHLIRPLDKKVLDSLNLKARDLSADEVGKVVNAHTGWLDKSTLDGTDRGMFALQDAQKEYVDRRVASGLQKNPDAETVPAYFRPQHIKLGYDVRTLTDSNGMVLEGMTYLKQKQKLYQQSIDNVFAHATKERAKTFADLTDEDITNTNRLGTGGGFTSSPNGNYGTTSSKVESIGVATHELTKDFVTRMSETLESARYGLKNSEAGKLEYSILAQQLRSTPENYVLVGDTLRNKKLVDYEAAIASGKKPSPPNIVKTSVPDEIKIANPEVTEYLQSHVEANDRRLTTNSSIRGVQSLATHDLTGNVYIPPPDPKKYTHFAFVIDESVTSTGHVSMLHAATEDQLSSMVNKVRTEFPEFTVATKEEQNLFHKAQGDYQYDLGLNENYIDTALKRKGISSFFPRTDGDKLLDEHLDWHVRQEQNLARELVSLKYSKQINELRRMGEQFTNIAASRYTGVGKAALSEIKNPYEDYVRTMLDISKASEYPLWTPLNRLLETGVSKLSANISEIWNTVKSTADLQAVNDALQKAGIKTAYYDAATELLANHSAPKPILSNFILKASGILSTLVLRADPLNAINNGIGANVLLGAEANHVVSRIAAGDTEAIGKLASLYQIKVPGTSSLIRSPAKLISQAYSDWWKSTAGDELHTLYKQNGWMTSISDQIKATSEHLILKGNETPAEMQSMLEKAISAMKGLGDSAEKWTGNKIAEEMNRFVAARTMHQLTEVAVDAGYMTEKEAVSYINTFVSRTQGARIASQRPVMFQGPIGHSISLFQTYQLNMMQQMFRYIADGGAKDAAILLGLQGTVYGMNGLPAFNAINTHLVGNAAGNRNHTDVVSSAYDVAGKEAGDWLLYGAASNMFLHPDLKVNLYSRGDINPRNVSIIPINPLDTPIVAGATKFFGAIASTVEKIAQGGNVWNSILQGIEHNGISRPLSGLAQTMEALGSSGKVYSTDAKGSIVNENDFLSLVTLGRIAGGKPLDEAIATDAVYRISAYKAKDIAETKLLGSAMRTTMIEDKDPSQDQVDGFLQSYVKNGGKQERFNQFMIQQYKIANKSQTNVLFENLKSPYSKNMQKVMGGYELDDFTN